MVWSVETILSLAERVLWRGPPVSAGISASTRRGVPLSRPQTSLHHVGGDNKSRRVGRRPRQLCELVATLIGLVLCGAALPARAQLELPAQHLKLSIGYGRTMAFSRPQDDRSLSGDGVFSDVEYYLAVSDWFSPRAYAGLLLTFASDDDRCADRGVACDVSTQIGFLGVKGRFSVPIPYAAPFLELGAGLSLGALRTRTLRVHEAHDGVTYHVPFAVGLALGPEHDIQLALAFLFHPAQKQATGACTVGLSLVLDSGKRPAEGWRL